jgi:tetratricopeptide (TPR) repeat protein
MKLNFYMKNLLKVIALILVSTSVAYAAKTSGNIGNGEVIKRIEKSLIFNSGARSQMNFYDGDRSKKESNFSIGGNGFGDEFSTSSSLDILVTNSKVKNLDIRERERLAYNATLVGQWEVAIELYKKILLSEPENNYAKLSLAISYQKIGQFSQAKNLYSELLESDIESHDLVIGNLLNILTEESPRDAIYLLSRLALQNPESPTILARTAMAYDKTCNYEKSIMFLQKAITLDNSRVDYRYNLAVIYDKHSKHEDALRLYSDIVKNDSQSRNIPISHIKKRVEFIKQQI